MPAIITVNNAPADVLIQAVIGISGASPRRFYVDLVTDPGRAYRLLGVARIGRVVALPLGSKGLVFQTFEVRAATQSLLYTDPSPLAVTDVIQFTPFYDFFTVQLGYT